MVDVLVYHLRFYIDDAVHDVFDVERVVLFVVDEEDGDSGHGDVGRVVEDFGVLDGWFGRVDDVGAGDDVGGGGVVVHGAYSVEVVVFGFVASYCWNDSRVHVFR